MRCRVTRGASGIAGEIGHVVVARDGFVCRCGNRGCLDAGRAVGRALAGICTTLDPTMIVVGGKTAAAGEPLLSGIRAALARGVSPSVNRNVRVVAGELGARAEALGAVALANRRTNAPLPSVQ
jgi:predicted NBD/HSP70 family sugar kinase